MKGASLRLEDKILLRFLFIGQERKIVNVRAFCLCLDIYLGNSCSRSERQAKRNVISDSTPVCLFSYITFIVTALVKVHPKQ